MNKIRHIALLCLMAVIPAGPVLSAASDRPPNFLLITYEDVSPHFGTYGEEAAHTPVVDHLAAEGVRFDNFHGVAAVCAPNRSALATGVYATSLGSQHMRTETTLPDQIKIFSEYLRDAGYYTVNIGKADYNFPVPETAWDNQGYKADWRDRAPGQPFLVVYNLVETHQGRVKNDNMYARSGGSLPEDQKTDRDAVTVPAWLPDTPVMREYIARNLDNLRYADQKVRQLLDLLEREGVADNTIVIFYSDHGDGGLPRAKTFLHDSGLRAPLIIKAPKGMRIGGLKSPGSGDARLISFIDLPATVLNLSGLPVPAQMQGQPFLGDELPEPRRAVFAARDRINNRYDIIRAVRTGHYKYIRNFRPSVPHLDAVVGFEDMPTTVEWRRVAREEPHLLPEGSANFLADSKAPEELYDLQANPGEVHNLAADPAYAETLVRFRDELDRWIAMTNDLGFIPEGMLRTLATDYGSEWTFARAPNSPYDALRASKETTAAATPLENTAAVDAMLASTNPVSQYWGAIALNNAPAEFVAERAETLRGLLRSDYRDNRLAAATALLKAGVDTDAATEAWTGTMLEKPFDWATVNGMNLAARLPDETRTPLLPVIKRFAAWRIHDSLSPRRYAINDAGRILGR